MDYHQHVVGDKIGIFLKYFRICNLSRTLVMLSHVVSIESHTVHKNTFPTSSIQFLTRCPVNHTDKVLNKCGTYDHYHNKRSTLLKDSVTLFCAREEKMVTLFRGRTWKGMAMCRDRNVRSRIYEIRRGIHFLRYTLWNLFVAN